MKNHFNIYRIILITLFAIWNQHSIGQRINKDSLWAAWTDTSISDSLRLEALHTIAGYGYLFTKPDSAYYYAQLEYNYAKSKGLKYHMGNALHTQGMSFMYQGAFDSAIIYYNRAISIRHEIDDKQGIAGSLNNIGNIYHEQDNYDEALAYYHKSFAIKEMLNDKKGMSKTLNNIGLIFKSKGNYAKAIDYYMKSLKLKEAIKDQKGIAGSLNNLGILYSQQDDYEKSFEFHQRSLAIKKELDDYEGMAASYNSIALYYKRKGDDDQAMKYQLKSLTIFKTLKYKRGIGVALSNLGLIYVEQNDLDKALKIMNESLTIRRELNDNMGTSGALTNIGGIYLKQNRYNQAIKYSQEGLSIAQEIGAVKQTKDAAHTLYEAYKAIGNATKALHMYELFTIAKDSIQSEENKREIIRQEYQYNYAKQKLADSLAFSKQKDIDQLNFNSELKRQSNIRYTLFTGIVLLLIIGIILYRNYRLKIKANRLITQQKIELERKNQEKTAMLKEIHHRVKNNLGVVNSLLRLQSREVEDEKTVAMFKEAQNRVLSMALLHEKMYRSDDLQHIDVNEHITLLVEDLIKSYAVHKNIASEITINDLEIGIETLVPLGLIINEIITNALKYAFNESDEGKIEVRIKQMKNHLELIIGDNGTGKDDTQTSSGLGEKLIHTFVKQLKGSIERLEQPGTIYRIQFQKID